MSEVTELLYLDYNCFQRSFDDQSQIRIQMEALACQEIFSWADAGRIRLAWSFMHEDESALCPFPERSDAALRLAALCEVRVKAEEEIRGLAKALEAQGRLAARDALHLACACTCGAACFLTCDDALTHRCRRIELDLSVMNPVDYLRLRLSP